MLILGQQMFHVEMMLEALWRWVLPRTILWGWCFLPWVWPEEKLVEFQRQFLGPCGKCVNQNIRQLFTQFFPPFNKFYYQDFSSSPVVTIPPCNVGDTGLIPSQGTNIPCAVEQLSPYTTCTEPMNYWAHEPQLGNLCTATKDPTWSNYDPVSQERPDAAKQISK